MPQFGFPTLCSSSPSKRSWFVLIRNNGKGADAHLARPIALSPRVAAAFGTRADRNWEQQHLKRLHRDSFHLRMVIRACRFE